MTVGIRGLNNQSDEKVDYLNQDNTSEVGSCPPKHFDSRVYSWIPRDETTGYLVTTCRNGGSKCTIWDKDWNINGRWDDDGQHFVLMTSVDNGTDYQLNVKEDGEVFMTNIN